MKQELHNHIRKIYNSDIPNGYKNTKFGIIPKDWKVMRLKDKFDRLSRKNAEGNTNVLTISAQYGLINQEEFFKKAVASDDKSNYYLLQRGEFAYNKSYSNGYPFGAIKRLSRYDKGVVSPLYICFSANADNACPEYYEQYFEAGKMNHEIQAFAQEGARNHGLLNISVSDFFNSFILVPPVSEQKRIAKILSTQDKVIECYEKKIAQLRLMKKYYLQNMFPKRGETVPKIRFKGFTGAWEQRKLSEIGERVTRKNQDLVSELPLTISAQYGLIDQNEFFDKRIASKDVSGYYLVKNGEFAYNKSTSVDAPWGAVKRLDKYEMGVLSTLYIVFSIIDKGKTDSDFLVTYYDTNLWHNGVQAVAAEGARNHGLLNISADDFLETSLSLPQDIEEQKLIGSYFKNLDNLITLHQRLCEEEKKKKNALQQLLLTGIVRTNE